MQAELETKVAAEVKRLDRFALSDEGELFISGAKMALVWLRDGGMSPAEYLDSRLFRSTLEH